MPPRKPEYDDASKTADRRRGSARGDGGGASAAGARA